jgi:hypothetical protein
MTPDLFVLLFNRVSQEDQLSPQFIGEFNGVQSLPKELHHLVYFWIDKGANGRIYLSFNTPLITRYCEDEAVFAGLNIDKSVINTAVEQFKEITTSTFQSAFPKIAKEFGWTV